MHARCLIEFIYDILILIVNHIYCYLSYRYNNRFYRILDHSRNQVVQSCHNINVIYTPMFRRSLFTIGILMRYFDFKMPCVTGNCYYYY